VEQVELTLEGILARAEKGEFPAADLELTVCPAPSPRASAVVAFTGHTRVRRALRYRDEVRVWACEGGVVLLGRGLAGRTEPAVEVEPAVRGRGWGRRLAAAARALAGGPLWAQVAPGNAASVRAFLAAGYLPVGAEALLVPALLVPDRAAGWN
jgi:GNAT superfamily N-acetyltransferase